MSVKIRLSRIGKRHVPFHRIIVVDSRKKRDAAYLDKLGTYDAHKSQVVNFNEERYNAWVSQGAQPTDSARKVYKQFKTAGLTSLKQDAKSTKTQKTKTTVSKETKEAQASQVTQEAEQKEAQAKTEKTETAKTSETKTEKTAQAKTEK